MVPAVAIVSRNNDSFSGINTFYLIACLLNRQIPSNISISRDFNPDQINLMRTHHLRRFTATALLLLLTTHAYADTPSNATNNPQQVARSFYSWYLKVESEDKDPLSTFRKEMQQYVTADCLKEIDRQMNSPDGMESDYFTDSQDYMDEWLTHIDVSTPHISGTKATEIVTLGNTPESLWKLQLTLVKDHDQWKIRSVNPLNTQ